MTFVLTLAADISRAKPSHSRMRSRFSESLLNRARAFPDPSGHHDTSEKKNIFTSSNLF